MSDGLRLIVRLGSRLPGIFGTHDTLVAQLTAQGADIRLDALSTDHLLTIKTRKLLFQTVMNSHIKQNASIKSASTHYKSKKNSLIVSAP